jgi:hypothetical protein
MVLAGVAPIPAGAGWTASSSSEWASANVELLMLSPRIW